MEAAFKVLLSLGRLELLHWPLLLKGAATDGILGAKVRIWRAIPCKVLPKHLHLHLHTSQDMRYWVG
jgi:hypothetical protein